jgi:hypothetical protein
MSLPSRLIGPVGWFLLVASGVMNAQQGVSPRWSVSDTKVSTETALQGQSPMGMISVTPEKGNKVLLISASLATSGQGNPSVGVDAVYVAPRAIDRSAPTAERNKYRLVALAAGPNCDSPGFLTFGWLQTGSIRSTTPAGEGFVLGRKQREDPITVTLAKNPSRVCLAFEVPDSVKDVVLFFGDANVGVSGKGR